MAVLLIPMVAEVGACFMCAAMMLKHLRLKVKAPYRFNPVDQFYRYALMVVLMADQHELLSFAYYL
jgi:hypothetical protein